MGTIAQPDLSGKVEASRSLGDVLAKRTPSASSPPVAFLQALDPTGWHNLVRIGPAGQTTGLTIPPGRWDLAERFVAEFDGRENLYFSVNEPKPDAPNKKLGKGDIAAIRAIPADIDLLGANDETAIELLQAKVSADVTGLPAPSFMIDSGGGLQLHWRLDAKMPANPENIAWAENQARGIAHELGGDVVGNVDRMMRLPGTLNIPNASKSAKGRVARRGSLLDQTGATHSREALCAALPPVSADTGDHLDRDEKIAELQKILIGHWSDIASASSLDELPTDLQARFQNARDSDPKLSALWNGEPPRSGDDSGSGYRAALARALAHAGGFRDLDFAALAWVWDCAIQAGHDRDEKLTPRTLARDWVRCGQPYTAEEIVKHYFDEDAAAKAREAAPSAVTSQKLGTTTIAWIDPEGWAGKPIPPRVWEVEQLIPKGEVTLLYGDGGTGKTLVMHQYAVAASAGVRWLGQPTRPARVMCFFCEDGEDELQRRHADILASLGLSHSDTGGRLRIASRRQTDNLLALWDRSSGAMQHQKVFSQLLTDAKEFGAEVIILDTIADIFGGDEVNRAQVTAFVKGTLGRLAGEIGGTVIALGHPSQSGLSSGDGGSGSTGWSNAVRSRLYLSYPDKSRTGNFRELTTKKSNYGARGSKLKIQWARGAFELVTSSLPAASAGSFNEAPNALLLDDAAERAVVDAINAIPDVRMSMAGPTSTYYAPKVLRQRAPEILEAFTAEEVEAAFQRLVRREALEAVAIGKSANRRAQHGLRVIAAKLRGSDGANSGIFE